MNEVSDIGDYDSPGINTNRINRSSVAVSVSLCLCELLQARNFFPTGALNSVP